MRTLAAALAATLLCATAVEARVALFMKRTYADTGANRDAGMLLQNLTPLLEMGGVDYRIYYIEDLGSSVAAQLTFACDDLDDVDGITVGVWLGGTHNETGNAWAPRITRSQMGFTPDYPMIWATPDAAARLNFPSSGASDLRTGSGGTSAVTNGRILCGASAGFSTYATFVPTLDSDITPWLGHVDVVAHAPGDTTKMYLWRVSSDTTGAHAQGWSYINLPAQSSAGGQFSPTMTFDYLDSWTGYFIIAEIVYHAPQEWRRDRPIHWGIDIDDELQAHAGTNLSDGLPYSAAGTVRDWYNTASLAQLGDSLEAWGDVLVVMGTNPDSVGTTEGAAKIPLYNDPDLAPYIWHAWHNHGSGRELNLYTTVAAVVAGGAAQMANLRQLDHCGNSIWSTGGLQSSNFYTSMTIDSLFAGYSANGLRYVRSTTRVISSDMASVTRTNPKTNSWLRRNVDGRVCVWYPWSGQSTTDTTRYAGSAYTDANRKHQILFTNSHLYRFSVVTHTPTFSFGRGVSPAVPPGLIWLQSMRSMKLAINTIAGREIVAFGRPVAVTQNMYYRPRPRRW